MARTSFLWPNESYNRRNVPLWALPQLDYITKTISNSTILGFHRIPNSDEAFFELYIDNKGRYCGLIRKSHMNSPRIVSLEWFSWATDD